MIDIYFYYYKDDNSPGGIHEGKTKVQTIPAGSESAIRLLAPVTKGDMGNASSMDLGIQNGTTYYDACIQMRTYVRVDFDGETIFYGRVLTVNAGFFGEQKIHCEGALAFLNDSYYPGTEKKNRKAITINAHINAVLNNHNAQVADDRKKIYPGEIPGNYSNSITSAQRIENASREFGTSGWQNSKSVLEDLKSHYGGCFRIRYSGERCYLDWMNHYFRSTVNTQTIEVGKNLLDISGSTEISNIFTAVIPVGKTSSSDKGLYLNGYTTNGHTFNTNYILVPEICSSLYNYGSYSDSQLNSGYHEASDYKTAITNYGRIFRTVDFQDAKNQDELFDKVSEWIKSNYQGGVETFSVKAIDLRFIGESDSKILVGDRVRIKYPVGTKTATARIVTRTLTCTSATYDLFNPENNQYTFGIPANALSKTYGDNTEKKKKTSSSYNPPKDPNEGEETEPDWNSTVLKWFATHKIYKRSSGTSKEEGTGPVTNDPYEGKLRSYFIETIVSKSDDGSYLSRILCPIVDGATRDPANPSKPVYHWHKSGGLPQFTRVYKKTSEITVSMLRSRLLFDYVKDEYGINLDSDLGVTKPPLTTDDNGNVEISVPGGPTVNIGTIIDPVTGAVDFEGIKTTILDQLGGGQDIVIETDKNGHVGYYKETDDGRKVMVSLDPKTGQYNYYDENGKETNIRDLKLSSEASDTFIGSMVTEQLVGQDGKFYTYKMGQAIERWAGGEMVVAYVDGDIVKIGSRDRTKKIYLTADQVILGDSDDAAKNVTDALIAAGVIDDDTLAPNSLVLSSVYARDINGINGRFQTIESQYLQTTLLAAKIADLTTMTVKSINAFTTDGSGLIIAKTLESPDIRLRSTTGTTSSSIRNIFVSSIELEGPTNNTYTLIARDADSNELYRKSFSRATSLSGTWSGRHLTVRATPQDQIKMFSLWDTIVPTGTVTVSGKTVKQNFIVYSATEDDSEADQILLQKELSINASDVYDNGRNYVGLADPTWNTPSGGRLTYYRTATIRTTGKPTNVEKQIKLYLAQDDNFDSSHKKNVYMRTNSTTGTTYAQLEVDASTQYTAGYNSGYSNGKYNWSHNAQLYCSDISYGTSGTKTVTLVVSYSASQSVPFSVGGNKRVYFD